MSKIKKQNILPIPPQFDRSKLQNTGNLLDAQAVNQTVANLTGQSLTAPTPTRSAGRPKKATEVERMAYNTMLRDDYIVNLKIMAAQKRVSVADLIDEALTDFFAKHSI
jgi:hypothetical protein